MIHYDDELLFLWESIDWNTNWEKGCLKSHIKVTIKNDFHMLKCKTRTLFVIPME